MRRFCRGRQSARSGQTRGQPTGQQDPLIIKRARFSKE